MFTQRHDLPHRLRTIGAACAVVVSLGLLAGCGESSSEASDPAASESPAASSASSAPSGDSSAMPRKQKLIELAEPAEGATVSGSFTASGKANSPEANVPWEIRDDAGEVAAHGHATAEGWMDKLYPWKTEVDVAKLDPGTYTFVAMTEDASGGAEGAGAQEVGATITVQ